jgi:hypothetical protein
LYDEKGLGKEETRKVLKKILSIFFCAFGRCLPRIGPLNFKKARDRISLAKQTHITFFEHYCSRVLKRTGKMVNDIQTVSFFSFL